MEAALEQYLILAKTAKGKACESLIYQAISNPKTFVFGELFDAVKEGGVSKDSLKVLEIFTYGTLSDYRRSKLPDLTSQQLKKLQMLTLTSLASENSILSYQSLQSLLEIHSTRSLEDLIIETIYEGLIKGKLDHKNSCLRVFECIGRDIRPEDIPKAINKIKQYLKHISSIEETAQSNISSLVIHKELSSKNKEIYDKAYSEQKQLIKTNFESADQGLISKMKKQLNIPIN
jgi:hypothetical protein